MARILSLERRISFEPRSPSGPPVMTLVIVSSLSPSLASDADDVLVDGARRHAVEVVGDAAHRLRLARGEGLPELVAALPGPQGRPLHEVGRALVGAEEEDDVLAVVVEDGGVREHQVEQAVDVLLEGGHGLVLEAPAEEDRALRAAVGQVLVLALLGRGQAVVLVEDEVGVVEVVLVVGGADDADAAPGDVPEADVEAAELAADDVEEAERLERVIDPVEEVRART